MNAKLISSYLEQDEIEISQEDELRETLIALSGYGNSVFLLEFPNSGVFTIGVGIPYGFVQYSGDDGSPPYLVLSGDPKDEERDSFVEFDSGGTPTPIPMRYCLPIERVVEIVLHFLRDKKLPDFVNWTVV